jgi:predicted RNA-binding protein YlqC (UPF0109 family)
MKEFLEYLLKNLTKYPDETSIREETTDDGTIVYYLKVHPDDIGKVIGKGGKVIWSIRTLLRVRAQKEGQRTLVKLEEPPPEEVPQEEITSQEESQSATPASVQSETPSPSPTDDKPSTPPTSNDDSSATQSASPTPEAPSNDPLKPPAGVTKVPNDPLPDVQPAPDTPSPTASEPSTDTPGENSPAKEPS